MQSKATFMLKNVARKDAFASFRLTLVPYVHPSQSLIEGSSMRIGA